MLDQVRQARAAYDRAQAAVEAAEQTVRERRDEVPGYRAALHAAVVEAVRARQATQQEIAEAAGYRREQVRRIARAAGVEPD